MDMNSYMNPVIWQDMQDVEKRNTDLSWLQGTTVMVTGAYGMLASYVVYFLIYLNETSFCKQPIQIYACGRNQQKMSKRFGAYCNCSYFHWLKADVCEEMIIDGPVDYIIHAASLASPQYYDTNPVGTLLPNTLGTYYLLELAREKGTKGFLFFSSGDVYGQVPPEISSVSELDYGYLDPMYVRNCYGESKRMGETMCKAWSHQYGVPAKSVRIYHTYGPTLELGTDQRMFSEFVNNIVNGEDIVMKSDGSAVRSLCYLADALDAFLRILKNGEPGTAYNMCNNLGRVSVKQLAETLVALFPEQNSRVVQVKREADSAYMESLVKIVTEIDTKRLQGLGWNPQYSIQEGFYRTVHSFLGREI